MLGTILIFSKGTRLRVLGSILLLAAVLAACGEDTAGGDEVSVIATTSIAGDLVSRVVGEAATVEVLVPIGADPHDFQPSSQQAAALRSADLVVAWGLGLEEGLSDVLASAAADGVRVLELSPLVDPLPYTGAHPADDHHDDDEEDDDEHLGLDAHTWMDPLRMVTAVREIAAALSDLAGEGDWEARAEEVAADVLQTHTEVESILARVPAERRKLVTNHDSLGYFAARYDFEVVGVAIPGGSTLASPSSAQVAELVEVIRAADVDVLFAESSNPAELLSAIAGEVEGVRVVELLEGSLAPAGEPGDDYLDMLVVNAETIAEVLGE